MASAMPTLHLLGWGTHRALVRAERWPPGPTYSGRTFTIMVAPRWFERGDGCVVELTPHTLAEQALLISLLRARRRDDLVAMEREGAQYRELLERRWSLALQAGRLAPGVLGAGVNQPEGGIGLELLRDGDALCCACSAAEATAGRCHRVWAAPILARAGWSVTLEGVALNAESTGPHGPTGEA